MPSSQSLEEICLQNMDIHRLNLSQSKTILWITTMAFPYHSKCKINKSSYLSKYKWKHTLFLHKTSLYYHFQFSNFPIFIYHSKWKFSFISYNFKIVHIKKKITLLLHSFKKSFTSLHLFFNYKNIYNCKTKTYRWLTFCWYGCTRIWKFWKFDADNIVEGRKITIPATDCEMSGPTAFTKAMSRAKKPLPGEESIHLDPVIIVLFTPSRLVLSVWILTISLSRIFYLMASICEHENTVLNCCSTMCGFPTQSRFKLFCYVSF